MSHRMLLIFAHPDDEAFGVSGTAALLDESGGETWLICATRGEEGEISRAELATRENLGEVRERELTAACRAVGMHDPIFLNFRDSGMIGTDPNKRPDAFMNADEHAVTSRLVTEIRRLQPDVVVTFDPSGIYGHPDHLAIHRFATAAYWAARDPEQYPEAGPAFSAKRLYYNTAPREMLMRFFESSGNLPPPGPDGTQFLPGTPMDEITTIVDVSSVLGRKREALAAHATQMSGDSPVDEMPEDQLNEWMSSETFLRVDPPHDGERETSLFANL